MQTRNNFIQSPLNYTGGKYKLLPQILPLFPNRIDTFVDLLCGGCNVGINVSAKSYIYNDINDKLCGLYLTFKLVDIEQILSMVDETIRKYGLSLVSEYGYSFYGCESGKGLSKYNKDKYLKLRNDFNSRKKRDTEYYVMLYVLIVYSFNNQIRFNGRNEFNLPVGKRDYNNRMRDKLITFIQIIKEQQAEFMCQDFRELDYARLGRNDFVYADPPYLITCASYNEKGGWNDKCEMDLLKTLDDLNEREIRFALSNVIHSKGKTNEILYKWVIDKGYRLIDLDYSYRNANYHRKDKDSVTREVLVINY